MTLILLTDGAHRRNSFARVKQKYSNSYLGARENSKYSFVLYFLMTKNLSLSSAFPVHLGTFKIQFCIVLFNDKESVFIFCLPCAFRHFSRSCCEI